MESGKRISAFSVFKKKRKLFQETASKTNMAKKDKIEYEPTKKRKVLSENSIQCPRVINENHTLEEDEKKNNEVYSSKKKRRSLPVYLGSSGKQNDHYFREPQAQKGDYDNTGNQNHVQEELPALPSSSSPFMFDSVMQGEHCFEWLIYPVKPAKFFSELWEKKPLLVRRHQPLYYKNIFSCKDLDKILREKQLQFTQNIDITSYKEGKRETHNPTGRAYASVVWNCYESGCSVRLLNPQTYHRFVWKLNSVLQEYFGSFVGANVYLTPPGTQGFAPHYDDIEAFVLQLEGRKLWKLYSPRQPNEALPRFSSHNFKQEEIGEPMLTVELKPGDLLYFPRGVIHQASTAGDSHSLHITLSTCQRNTWGDLLEKMVPRAVQLAFEEDVEFRKLLPRKYMHHMGVAHSDVESPDRDTFLKMVRHLMTKLIDYVPVDAAVDQLAKNYIHDCLPPVLTEREKMCSIHGDGEKWCDGKVQNVVSLKPITKIKLIRQNVLRLVMEENAVRVYHAMENSRVYHEMEPNSIEIGAELAPAVEFLLHVYPKYVAIEDLPLDNLENKMSVASLLYESGLLVTEEPLQGK